MAVGLKAPEALPAIPGIRLGIARAGIRKSGAPDICLIELAEGGSAAAVFTRNAFCAAPVTVAREHLRAATPRYLVINAGNANAGTGAQGQQDALDTCQHMAELAGTSAQRVLPFSTGVIGECLPMDKLLPALGLARDDLAADHWGKAATAIMTTDTLPKGVSRSFETSSGELLITGIAKGAGMIRPDMATMLAFVGTNAAVDANFLQELLQECVDESFNRITIDGDTSTNDACVVLASGELANDPIDSRTHTLFDPFMRGLRFVCHQLAQAIVRDGEGATKFVTITVAGGRNAQECLDVGYTIAHSPLVKTALFASDANWGRILAAIGRAGLAELDVSRVSVSINGVIVAQGGCRAPDLSEELANGAMAAEEILLRVELGRGGHSETLWTTDLSHEYVRINAEYRT